MDRSFWGPYNIFLVMDRSIYCHMTLSAMIVNNFPWCNVMLSCISNYYIQTSYLLFILYVYWFVIVKKDQYYMDRSFWGPYNIFLVMDRSIYCHMTLSAMNYLLYIYIFESEKMSLWNVLPLIYIVCILICNSEKRPANKKKIIFYL
jgi:hypothetical protein